MTATRPAPNRRVRGLTLIEMCVCVTVVGIVAAAAIPAHRNDLARARRADAVAALQRVQHAQALYRDAHGHYASALDALQLAPRSSEGWYQIGLHQAAPDQVTVIARAQGEQEIDRACPELTLHLNQGFAEQGPRADCWNR